MRKIIRHTADHSGDPVLHTLLSALYGDAADVHVTGLHGSSYALVLSLLFRRLRRTILVAAASVQDARTLFEDLSFFMEDGRVFYHAPWDLRLLASDDVLSFQHETVQARIRVLTELLSGGPLMVVAPVEALLQRVIPMSILGDYLETISPGDRLDRDRFVEKLASAGYRSVSLVEEPGEFCVRGFIIDLFSPAADGPVRIELFGDDIESLRRFNPETQRSRGELSSAVIAPAGEIIATGESKDRAIRNLRERAARLGVPKQRRDTLATLIESGIVPSAAVQFLPLYYDEPGEGEAVEHHRDTLLDYLPRGSIAAFHDFPGITDAERDLQERLEGFLDKARREERFFMDPSSLFIPMEEFHRQCAATTRLYFDPYERRWPEGSQPVRFSVEPLAGLKQQDSARQDSDEGLLSPFASRVRIWLRSGVEVAFVCAGEELQRVSRLLQGYGLPVVEAEPTVFLDPVNRGEQGRLLLLAGKLSEGFFSGPMGLAVVSDDDLFGKKIRRRRRSSVRDGYFLQSFGELKEGDAVVHLDHGIALYRGLKRLSAADIENDFLLLEYAGGDRLYVPVDRLDCIQRYVGPDGYVPPSDRLGGASWESVKKRVKESIRKIAEDLVALYASREVMEGYGFSMNERASGEFAASFEFEETPDQARAIDDINQDMSDPKPMDRLVCGDAGFGKTEVALRAAFRAAMDGKQVAVLVPTTILAEQHYRTFTARFTHWPLRVEVLNRFKTAKEQKAIVADVNRGVVDIVIGTHRLLQKDVVFRDLGLVVIDEEHRFGVAHKEKLKKLRTVVDVLTLTATPIPRTLQLSLAGLRDLSVIDTAPHGRQTVQVFVAEFDEGLIRDAILEELNRGGQVFFIHDRVRSIEGIARTVGRIVPEARVAVAHGQMKTAELETVMMGFLERSVDVLVSTTIIGSGVDIPTANTIIINRADRFGLSQLYQLRGRVGRSSERAVAWLLIPRDAVLSKDARKRLQVVQEFSEPGSGFRIAAYDLEIRGAGNMLGVSQSGHVSAVGYEMYMELMEKTVMELQGREMPRADLQPEIHLGIPAFLPDEYVTDTQGRLILYKKASLIASEEELAEFREELSDRYGPVPAVVDNLLGVVDVKVRLRTIRGRELRYDGSRLSLLLSADTPVSPDRIVACAKQWPSAMRFDADNRLTLTLPGLDHAGRLDESRRLIDFLSAGGSVS